MRRPEDDIDWSDRVLERATSDLVVSLRTLLHGIEVGPVDGNIMTRAKAFARNIVYWCNRLPPPGEDGWPRTKQIQHAARFVQKKIVAHSDASIDPEIILRSLRSVLSETLVHAHVENQLLATFRGNVIDPRRTARILRELSRTLPLECENALK